MSWKKDHGGTNWHHVDGTNADVRKTSNGWWQVRRHEVGAPVEFSNRDVEKSYAYARAMKRPSPLEPSAPSK